MTFRLLFSKILVFYDNAAATYRIRYDVLAINRKFDSQNDICIVQAK